MTTTERTCADCGTTIAAYHPTAQRCLACARKRILARKRTPEVKARRNERNRERWATEPTHREHVTRRSRERRQERRAADPTYRAEKRAKDRERQRRSRDRRRQAQRASIGAQD